VPNVQQREGLGVLQVRVVGLYAACAAELDLKAGGLAPRREIKESRHGGTRVIRRVDELGWVEAAGNYVCLHASGEQYLHRETMAHLEVEAALDPGKFARIHRSAIVNVDRVKELHPVFRGDYGVILCDGTHLTLSKVYRDRLSV
jgi:two-component system, LytTR family, response regulator